MPFQKVEFEFPHDDDGNEKNLTIEVEGSSAETIDTKAKKPEAPAPSEVDSSDDGFEIEVVDDTPKADRNRKPSDPPEDVTEEELEDYSEKVRRRIQHFSKGYHDERREKEKALREREELERLSQRLVEENKKLKDSEHKSQTALLENAKKSAEAEINAAKRAYKRAYDAGDSDKVLAAQDRLSTAKIKADKLEEFKLPQEEYTLPVDSPEQESAPQPVQIDEKTRTWQKENPWFNEDEEMTSFALGLHNRLVKEGVDPQTDDYYERINTRMREVFPENFEDEPEVRRRSNNVVAPATRSTAPKKIRLTQTQLTLAKRLGLTPEQYAKQVALDMRKQ
tara:strand:- start:1584 stop:2594 length:1011 start_codon:yes stop_codon:yes gene_type:complete